MSKPEEIVWEIGQVESELSQAGKRYREFLRVPALSTGLYVLPAGSVDAQSPHNQDEVYFVLRGKARMRVGSTELSLQKGSVVFVAAKVVHAFYEIEEELAVLVFFAPAES